MEPANEQYGASRSDQWPRDVGPRGWAPAEAPPADHGRAGMLTRARTGVIVLVALLTELVIIAAADNQWVSDRIARNELRTNNQTIRSLAGSWLTYTWRVSPRPGSTDVWWSQLALVLTVLVLSGVLVAAVVRGPITFGRAFFGTWMAVIVATQVGAFVRGLIEPNSSFQMRGADRVTRAVFSGFGPNQQTVAAGFGLGLVVALVAAIAAVASRRSSSPIADPSYAPAEPPPYVAPEQPPPFFGHPGQAQAPSDAAGRGGPLWHDQRYGPPAGFAAPPYQRDDASATAQLPSLRKGDAAGGDQPTTQLPRPAEGDDATAQFRPVGGPPPSEPPPSEPPLPPSEPPAGDQPTSRFPRPPNDEDLGHDPGRG